MELLELAFGGAVELAGGLKTEAALKLAQCAAGFVVELIIAIADGKAEIAKPLARAAHGVNRIKAADVDVVLLLAIVEQELGGLGVAGDPLFYLPVGPGLAADQLAVDVENVVFTVARLAEATQLNLELERVALALEIVLGFGVFLVYLGGNLRSH